MLLSTFLQTFLSSSVVGFIVVTNSLLDMSSFSRRPSSTSTWKVVGWLFYFFRFNSAAMILID